MEAWLLSEGGCGERGGSQGRWFVEMGELIMTGVRAMERDLCGENQFREETAQTKGRGESERDTSLAEIMSGPTAGSISLYLKGIARQHPTITPFLLTQVLWE